MTRILTRKHVEGLLTIREVIDAVELAHADLANQLAIQPAPSTLSFDPSDSAVLPMAARAKRQGLSVVKLLSDIPNNAARGLPVQRSVIVLVSEATGACEAIIDGQIPTRQRTAAASAVATRHLARRDSRVLGLVGAGNLAVEHVGAIAAVLPIVRVLVWSRTQKTVDSFIKRVNSLHPGLEVEAVGSAEDVVRRSELVCTLTPSREPLVRGEWFSAGQHINAVGAPPRADHREIDSIGIARAKLFVDSVATALKKSGDVLLAIADGAIGEGDVHRELGDVISGKAPGRSNADEITLFNSVGIALQDLAIGSLLVQRARANNIGLELDMSS